MMKLLKKLMKNLMVKENNERKMIKVIKDFDVSELLVKRKKLAFVLKSMAATSKYQYKDILPTTKYVTYTNIKTVYKFLDSDSLFVFCSELSNDLTENNMFETDDKSDVYISCFFQGNEKASDTYSQWLAYCNGGGASFEFYFGQASLFLYCNKDYDSYSKDVLNCFNNMNDIQKNMFNYSLLCNNSKKESDYYLYPNYPIYVQYCDSNNEINYPFYKRTIEHISNSELLLPYIKHSGFVQESEARLAFINKNHRLDPCIKFMEKGDNTKVPYIEVKFGDIDKNNRPCVFGDITNENVEERIKNVIEAVPFHMRNAEYPIVIPQGNNQEEVYNLVEKYLKESHLNIKIICQGHLPITKITLAPTIDSAQQKKKLEIYCQSKYWLRNVEICESNIPYNIMNNNH